MKPVAVISTGNLLRDWHAGWDLLARIPACRSGCIGDRREASDRMNRYVRLHGQDAHPFIRQRTLHIVDEANISPMPGPR
jgi:hypothetical protein